MSIAEVDDRSPNNSETSDEIADRLEDSRPTAAIDDRSQLAQRCSGRSAGSLSMGMVHSR